MAKKRIRRVPLTDDSQFDLACRIYSVRDGVIAARKILWDKNEHDAAQVPGILSLVVEQLTRIDEIVLGLTVAVDEPKSAEPPTAAAPEKGLRLVHDSTRPPA